MSDSNGDSGSVRIEVGASPIVTELGNQLIIAWPAGRGETFVIRTALFESMITDINGGKRLAAALDRIRLTVEELG